MAQKTVMQHIAAALEPLTGRHQRRELESQAQAGADALAAVKAHNAQLESEVKANDPAGHD